MDIIVQRRIADQGGGIADRVLSLGELHRQARFVAAGIRLGVCRAGQQKKCEASATSSGRPLNNSPTVSRASSSLRRSPLTLSSRLNQTILPVANPAGRQSRLKAAGHRHQQKCRHPDQRLAAGGGIKMAHMHEQA